MTKPSKLTRSIDIMRVTLEQQETGYSKITRYCQFEVRQYTREGQLEVSDTMREAMKRLRGRDDLFRCVIASP